MNVPANRNRSRAGAGLGFESRLLRLVKSGPELRAIKSGQVDAIVDPATGQAILLPEAQQSIRQEQSRERSLLALLADWTWEMDETYRFVSHARTEAGNVAPYDEGIVGKRLWELPFDVEEADWKVHRRLLEWRTTFRSLELACTGRAGEVRLVSFSGEPLFDEASKFTGYRGTSRDVTERSSVPRTPRAGASRAAVLRRETESRGHPEGRPPGVEREVATQDRIANRLLAALPRKDYLSVLRALEPVTLTYGTVLYEPGEPIAQIFFPVDCVVSLLTVVEDGRAMEVGLVGWEGMVGVSPALGFNLSSVRALVQGSGTAMRMKTMHFRRAFERSLSLQDEVRRYTFAKLAQARRTVACNHFHPVEARLARWLLMTRDRVLSDEFFITQEFLSHMLGVRRTGITAAAGALQRRDLIRYSRGKITVADPNGLETASCSCYTKSAELPPVAE